MNKSMNHDNTNWEKNQRLKCKYILMAIIMVKEKFKTPIVHEMKMVNAVKWHDM